VQAVRAEQRYRAARSLAHPGAFKADLTAPSGIVAWLTVPVPPTPFELLESFRTSRSIAAAWANPLGPPNASLTMPGSHSNRAWTRVCSRSMGSNEKDPARSEPLVVRHSIWVSP
jgi:hypothetical protein